MIHIGTTSRILLLALMTTLTVAQASDYKSHFTQKKDQYTMDRDRTQLPFKDTLNDENAVFKITEFDEKNADQNKEEWDD